MGAKPSTRIADVRYIHTYNIFQKTGKDKKENKSWKIRTVKQKEGGMGERGKK